MSDWQAIETAPKDATRVWLWNGYRRCYGWYSRYGDGSEGWHRQSLMGEPCGSLDIEPDTHWMPFPEPPQAADAVAGTVESGKAGHVRGKF